MTQANWHKRKTREGNKKNDKITNIWHSLFHSNSTIFPLFNLVKSWIFFLFFFFCLLSVCGREREEKKQIWDFFQDFPPQLSSFCHRSSSFSHYPGGCSWLVGLAKLFDSKFEKKNTKKKNETQTHPLIFNGSLDSRPEQMHHPSKSGHLLICRAAAGGVCRWYLVEHLLHTGALLRVNTPPLEGRPNQGTHRKRC